LSGDGFGSFAPGGPKAPVFVTLRGPGGVLRGCIGALVPAEGDAVHETARNAVYAATRDPRCSPILLRELAGLSIEVSVVGSEEPVDGISALDPTRYGLIVRDTDGRQGMLLPLLDGIADVETQVRLAREKAGIAEDAVVAFSRFGVSKWTDDGT
jgi:AMMECR1 domain-containing protein